MTTSPRKSSPAPMEDLNQKNSNRTPAIINCKLTSPTLMEDLYRQRLSHHSETLVLGINNPEDLVDRLVTMNVFNAKIKQYLRTELQKGMNEHNTQMIRILLQQQKQFSPIEKFVSALEHTGHSELAGLLKSNISPDATLSARDKQFIQSHYSDIVLKMRLSQVIKILREEEPCYFNEIELQNIQALRTERERNEYLITEVIFKGSYRHLTSLKNALLSTGQQDIAKYFPADDIRRTPDAQNKDTVHVEVQIKMEDPAVTADRRATIVSKFTDPGQDLHKKVKKMYSLTDLVAVATQETDDTLLLTMKTKHAIKVTKVIEDIQSRHLAANIMQYAHLPEKDKWRLTLTVKPEDDAGEASHTVNYAGNANAPTLEHTPDPTHKSSGYKSMGDPTNVPTDFADADPVFAKTAAKPFATNAAMSKPRSGYVTGDGSSSISKSTKPPSYNADLSVDGIGDLTPTEPELTRNELLKNSKTLVFDAISGKDHTCFDFYKTLLVYKAANVNILEVTNDGMNILHDCVDKGRLSFLPAIVYIGWWTLLYKSKVSQTSSTDFKGKTVLEIAETKRAKKPLADVRKTNDWEASLSVLMKACRSGDKSKAIKQTEYGGEEMYYCDSNGGNALYWTVVNGNKDLFTALVGMGLDPTVHTKKKENILHIAVMTGNCQMIPLLMKESYKIDPWLQDHGQKTPVDRVAENGHIDSLKAFMKCGIKPKESNIVLAAFMGREAYVVHLLDEVRIPIDSLDMYSRTALHRACEGTKVQLFNYLLQRGADFTRLTCSRRNLLHIAAECGSVELLDLVIQLYKKKGVLGDMINMRDRYNGVELCFLIRGRDKGRDAWHYVEVKRDKVPIFLLKTKQGNVDVRLYGTVIDSGWGISPTQEVIEEIEEKFKERRLNPEAADDMIPLHIALYKGHQEVAKKLIEEESCKVNTKDCFGNTPLLIAASKGDLQNIQALEKRGCDFTVQNNEGRSVLAVAELNQHQEVENYVKGRDFDGITKSFTEVKVAELEEKLSEQRLNQVRAEGGDVKRHIIDSLREFRIHINEALREMGSGPVLEASDDHIPSTMPYMSHDSRQGNHQGTPLSVRDDSGRGTWTSGQC